MRNIILKSPTEQMVLPVTPEHYQISHGQTVEIINIHQLGDIALPGRPTLCKIDLDLLLPSSPRSYSLPQIQDPEWYLWHWRMWVDQGAVLRFIVSDTYINLPVLVEKFTDGEKDGTGDRYCSLTLREFRYTETAQVQGGAEAARAAEAPPDPPRQYTVVRGDCLSAICRRFYGDGTAAVYRPLAAYNNIQNPDLIFPGQVIRLPSRQAL